MQQFSIILGSNPRTVLTPNFQIEFGIAMQVQIRLQDFFSYDGLCQLLFHFGPDFPFTVGDLPNENELKRF